MRNRRKTAYSDNEYKLDARITVRERKSGKSEGGTWWV